jgi:hypothetical protein
MTAIRFKVETTFDIKSRGGILAPGELLTGVIGGGTILRMEDTEQTVRVLGVELLTPVTATDDKNMVTLLLDRTDAPAISSGTVLIGPA